ncbi:MAG: adenosylcobinamide-GDP ribazoletransferase [Ruminococcus sp.]|nr:adenosylcobinamide-GDP ribazoletransferase [Ruminococcus sp.]
MLKSMLSAFLMYSRIPVPQVEWKEENRRYSLCFFPLIGVVQGIIFTLWRILCTKLNFGEILFSCVAVFIPVLVNGGIHLDGFCDTSDMLASYGDKEKRLKILSDSHIGAFAGIRLAVYFILQIGIYSEVKNIKLSVIISLTFVLSRILSSFGAVTFRCAKKSGSLQDFVRPSHKKISLVILSAWLLVCVSGFVITSLKIGICAVILATSVFVYYRYKFYKEIGGITGDTAGWFLQVCELVTAFSILIDN